MRAIASRTQEPDEAEDVLHESRKKIARDERATITGANVLQVEDFQIDLKSVKKSDGSKADKGYDRKSGSSATVGNLLGPGGASPRKGKKHDFANKLTG